MIIGRIDEKKQLEKIYNSSEAEFVAVYGRRRVGKAFLIKGFFAEKECLFFQASGILKATAAVQLEEFKKAVENTFNIDKEYAVNLQNKARIYQKVTQTKKKFLCQ